VLLTPFALLTAFGLGLFLLGSILDYTGIAAVGAVVVIAVGGGVAVTGLNTVTGETVDRQYTTVNNQTVVDSTTSTQTTETVAPLREFGDSGPLSLGGLQMAVGGLLFARRLNDEASVL
jgi:hypothetical protein